MKRSYHVALSIISQTQQSDLTSTRPFFLNYTTQVHGKISAFIKLLACKKALAIDLQQGDIIAAIKNCETIFLLAVPNIFTFNERILSEQYQELLNAYDGHTSTKTDWLEYKRLGIYLIRILYDTQGINGLLHLMVKGSDWAIMTLCYYCLQRHPQIAVNQTTSEIINKIKDENIFLFYFCRIIIPLAQCRDSIDGARCKQLQTEGQIWLKHLRDDPVNRDERDRNWRTLIQISYFFMYGIASDETFAIELFLQQAVYQRHPLALPLIGHLYSFIRSHQQNLYPCSLPWLFHNFLNSNTCTFPKDISYAIALLCILENQENPTADNHYTSDLIFNHLVLQLGPANTDKIKISWSKYAIRGELSTIIDAEDLHRLALNLLSDNTMASYTHVSENWKIKIRSLPILSLAKIIIGDVTYQALLEKSIAIYHARQKRLTEIGSNEGEALSAPSRQNRL